MMSSILRHSKTHRAATRKARNRQIEANLKGIWDTLVAGSWDSMPVQTRRVKLADGRVGTMLESYFGP
jgi:hypothetical protein